MTDSDPFELHVRVIGADPVDGVTIVTIDGDEYVCRTNTGNGRPHSCSHCGNRRRPCAHLNLAAAVRRLRTATTTHRSNP